MNRSLRALIKSLIAIFAFVLSISLGTTNANAFAGTLENGNLAYAAGSGFDKGEACDYLPGFTTGYDAWHFVLTTRGATFQQSPTNPAVAINLNFIFMRQDGTLFTIKSGAWVQTGKGAYTYTPVADKIRMVQAGTLAQINGSDSGMRLSHTCPGTGSVVTPTTSPTPTPTASPSTSATPTPSTSSSPSPSASATPTPTPTPSASVNPTPTPSSTVIPTLRPRPNPTNSAIQVHPTATRSPLPTPTPTPQGITEPTPTPTPSPSASPTRTPTPTPSPSATPTEPNNPAPPVLPTPPPVEDPKNVEYTEPKKPVDIDPQTFPEPPSTPVVVTKEPTYGTLTTNTDGTFTYTPPATPPAKPVVDVVEFKYTNLSGEATVVRKEFVMTVKGDVPSIIQTGDAPISKPLIVIISGLLALATATFTRRQFSNKAGRIHA